MATTPMQPPADEMLPEAPATQDMGEMEEMEPEGFTVCIAVDSRGKMSVGMKPGTEGSEGYMPAKDRKDALTMALEILKADGDESALAGREQMSSAFSSGYGED